MTNRAQRRALGIRVPLALPGQGQGMGEYIPRYIRRHGLAGLSGDMKVRRNRRARARVGLILRKLAVHV